MKPHIGRIVLPLLAAGMLQAHVGAPRIGVMRLSDASVRAVYGLPGNFVPARAAFAHGAHAASFSDTVGLIATATDIQLLGPDLAALGSYRCSEKKPVLNVTADAASAVAWLPSEHKILYWTGTRFRTTEAAQGFEGQVASIERNGQDRAELFVLNSDGSASRVSIVLSTGEFAGEDAIPGVMGPAVHLGAAFVFPDHEHLVVLTADGIRHDLAVPSGVVIERLSSQWLHLFSPASDQHWGLRLHGSEPEVFVLPATAGDGASK